MKTLVMIANGDDVGTWPFDLLDRLGHTHWTDATRKMAEDGEAWIAVDRDDAVREHYESDELARIERVTCAPAFYGIEANAPFLLERYLLAVPEGDTVLIDNDHGWIAPIADYRRAISQGVPWLYAEASPLQGGGGTASAVEAAATGP